ncbi:hypothetical protein DdX_16845 [Ditylenchus destructor]|uniref:Uncharacterized protein n=1 Tax=Ditylenchus destructor TaxID=166010 RepID=A0AAD4MSY0_9BILA|nr:hypothetical protein DdX_16845 [Ditylenchus destructor]
MLSLCVFTFFVLLMFSCHFTTNATVVDMRLNVNGVQSATKVKCDYPPRADQLCTLGSATYRNTVYSGAEPPPGIQCSYSYAFIHNIGEQIQSVDITTGKVVYVFDEKQRVYKSDGKTVEKIFEVRENPIVWPSAKPTGKWVWNTLELSKGVEIRIGDARKEDKIAYNDTAVDLKDSHSIFVVKL